MARKSDNFIKQAYSKVIEIMSGEFRLDKKDFPKLKIVDGDIRAYDHTNNIIIFGREKQSHAIEVLSEEVGHYVRAKLRGAAEKGISVDETSPKEFGFQASLMVYEKMAPDERQKFFPHGRPTLLEHYETRKKVRKITENALGILIIAGFITALFLLTGNLTGYLIAGYEIQSAYGFVLLIILVILGAIWIWLKHQNLDESKKLEKQISSIKSNSDASTM